jgi:hypothetical protein
MLIFVSLPLVGCNTEFMELENLKKYKETTYYLDAKLDHETSKLFVNGSIVYHNDKQDFDEIYLTMFANAYNKDSDTEDNVTFNYFKINNVEYDVIFSGEDNTSIKIDLEETMLEDTNYLIEFDYEFKYWDQGDLFNEDDYYNTMYWYPFVNVYDEFGWNIEPYSFIGDSYYNDVGTYYVKLNVPNGFLVASSGPTLDSMILDDNTIEIHYGLESARDFSFSTSPNYYVYRSVFNYTNFDIYSLRNLTSIVYRDVYKMIDYTFYIFEDYLQSYDYKDLTIVISDFSGTSSTGLIFCDRTIDDYTITKELIHQFIGSYIGSDPSDFSFLDESLTTFLVGLFYLNMYSSRIADTYFKNINSLGDSYSDNFTRVEGTSMLRKVDDYGDDYEYIICNHGATIFNFYVNEFLDGDYDIFVTFLKEYSKQYKYENVSLHEFLTLLEESTSVDGTYEWFMDNLNTIQVLEVPE